MSKFITIEGTDCAGKTSIIIPYLQKKLGTQDYLFVADMKTGKISQGIRNIFMDPDAVTEKADWRTIAFLSAAARSDLVTQEIIPALNCGKNVICDRYVDTAFVYNLKSDMTPVHTILNLSTHLVYPDVTIFAHCSYEEMLKRKGARQDNDQWDISSEEEYINKIERYHDQLNSRKSVVIEIDTSGTIEDTYLKLDEILDQLM